MVWKITKDDKDVVIIDCGKDGINIKCTDEGKNLCAKFCGPETGGCC